MSQTYQIHCLSTALSRITEGNEALLARQPVMTPDGKRFIPCLSGNALRQRMVRGPGGRYLIERWGLRGKLTLRQLNFMLHGGALTESTNRQDSRGMAEFHRLFPLYRLIGGCLPDAILPGSLIVDAGTLVCRENAGRVRAMVPADCDVPDNLRGAEAFVDGYQYTKSDARNTAADLVPPDAPGDESNLMIFAGQSVTPGAAFVHSFIAKNVSELEVGALLMSFSLWQASGSTIGGQSARGHGRLETLIQCNPDVDAEDLIEAYAAHVESVKDEAPAWLENAMKPKPVDPKKAKKGKVHEAAQNHGEAE